MDSSGRKIIIIVGLAALLVGFAGGFWFDHLPGSAALEGTIQEVINRYGGQPDNVDFSLFWDVWDSLHGKYVDKGQLDTKKLLYGAISGMVNSVGDPYTVFFEPVESKKFQEEISGSFSGVGMEVGKRNNILTVIAPLKDSPASREGIKAGDKITKIDTKSTVDMSVEEAVNLIRGPKGSKVKLTISRNGSPESKEIILTRDTIKIPSLEWKLIDGHIAYLALYSFNQNIDDDFKKAAEEIAKSGADRLILDVRNNPGGLLDSAVNLAGWFMDRDSLVTIQDFGGGNTKQFRTYGNALLKQYPTVILVNGGSASASEILAGAITDNRGIKLIGEKTFGKGSVQELQKFSNGSSLKVTVAKWLTPKGNLISEKGLEPDISVTIDQEKLESEEIFIGEPGKDPQLDKAMEVVNNL